MSGGQEKDTGKEKESRGNLPYHLYNYNRIEKGIKSG